MSIRVLLVDDDATVRDTLPPALAAVDPELEVVPVGTVQRAFERAIGQPPFDLVILDAIMPRRDGSGGDGGRWLVLKLADACPSLRTILYTGEPDARSAVVARLAGATIYLTKPCNPVELARLIRASLAAPSSAARPHGNGPR
jgi:DNA-binding NtrC family response regulator